MIKRYFLGYRKSFDWSSIAVALSADSVETPDSADSLSLYVDESNENSLSYKDSNNEITNVIEGEIE